MRNIDATIARNSELAFDLAETIEMLKEQFENASLMFIDAEDHDHLRTLLKGAQKFSAQLSGDLAALSIGLTGPAKAGAI